MKSQYISLKVFQVYLLHFFLKSVKLGHLFMRTKLLAPQSGAHTIAPHRDFHPIPIPIPSNPLKVRKQKNDRQSIQPKPHPLMGPRHFHLYKRKMEIHLRIATAIPSFSEKKNFCRQRQRQRMKKTQHAIFSKSRRFDDIKYGTERGCFRELYQKIRKSESQRCYLHL